MAPGIKNLVKLINQLTVEEERRETETETERVGV